MTPKTNYSLRTRWIKILLVFLLIDTNLCAQVVNAGVSGNSSKDLLERIESDVLVHDSQLVIVMVGTNDMLNSKKMQSYSDYKDNLESIVDILKRARKEVVLVSPPPVDSVYLFQRHDRSLFDQTPNVKMDSVRSIMSAISRQQNTYFFDLYEKFSDLGLPNHNQDLFIKNPTNSGKEDGVHPTSLGYHFIASHIFRFLKETLLTDKAKSIVCFGDSITYGGGYNSLERLTEANYPTYLQCLLADINPTK